MKIMVFIWENNYINTEIKIKKAKSCQYIRKKKRLLTINKYFFNVALREIWNINIEQESRLVRFRL